MSFGAILYSHTSEEREKQMEQERDREENTALRRFLDCLEEQHTELYVHIRIPEEENTEPKRFLEFPFTHLTIPALFDWKSEPQENQEKQMEQKRNRFPFTHLTIPRWEFPFTHLTIPRWEENHFVSPSCRIFRIVSNEAREPQENQEKQMARKRDWLYLAELSPWKFEEEKLPHMRVSSARLLLYIQKIEHMRVWQGYPSQCIARTIIQLKKLMKQKKDREVAPKSEQQEKQMTTGRFLLWDDVQPPFFRWLCRLLWDKEQLERKNQQLKAQLEACETEKEQLEEKYRKLKALLEASVSETEKIVFSCENYSLEDEESDDTDDNEDNYCTPKQLRENIKKGISESEEYQNAMKSLRERKNALNFQTVTGE